MNDQEKAQLDEMKKSVLAKILTPKAYERLSRARIGNPVVAEQVSMYLLQINQTGKIGKRINEEQLKEILSVLSEKKKTKIKRK